jgi:hypothetical protein
MNLMNTGMILLSIVIINYIVTAIMDFLGVSIVSYMGYLIWFLALILLWAILPKERNYFS